ncbi:GrpB family protein [Limimaricola sp. AA108-03]|uniref:GrpB family protein n=1 Tax=Limimaricola sp. AA108-03 TaxID=3425945 RepID=UPI003D78151F
MRDLITPHDPNWSAAFDAEARAVQAVLAEVAIALHHIGSTAIPGIPAKPVIDMLGVVPELGQLDRRTVELRALGYVAMGAYGIEGRRYFLKKDAAGRHTHHLHVYPEGSAHIERHLVFRDYLRQHPEQAAAYGTLKLRLTNGGARSREAYQDGKAPFIMQTERKALDWCRGPSKTAG